jgi:hypothetical protein
VAQVVVVCAVIVVHELSLRQQWQPGGFGQAYLAQSYWDRSLGSLVRIAVEGTYATVDFAFPAGPLLLFLTCLGLLAAVRTLDGRAAALMFAVPMTVSLAAAVARLYPHSGSRQSMFLLPMMYVLAGFGFDHLSKWDANRILVTISLVLVFGLTGFRSTVPYLLSPGAENIKPVTNTLSAQVQQGDRIYIYSEAVPAFRYYYRRDTDRWIQSVSSTDKPESYYQQLDAVLGRHGRVWMVFTRCIVPYVTYNRCDFIVNYASRLRSVELISASDGAWLYLAQ